MTNSEHIAKAVTQVSRLSKQIYDLTLSPETKKEITNFLQSKHLHSDGIFVVFNKCIILEDHSTTTINTNECTIHLSYGKNNRKQKYSNLLIVTIEKTNLTKFKTFWINRQLPISLLNDVIKKVNFNDTLYIDVLNNSDAWYDAQLEDYEKAHGNYFIKKTFDVNNTPVVSLGYYITEENRIVITDTRNKIKKVTHIFYP